MRFLFVDRIVESIPGKLIRGLKHITYDDPYLYKNEEGRSCFAAALIGETLGQLAAWNVMAANDFTQRPVAGVVASASLHRPAYVGETLFLESTIDNLDETAVQYHSTAFVRQEKIFTVEGALGPLLPMSRFIQQDEVRRQYEEIYRPCDNVQEEQGLVELLEAPLAANVFLGFDRILLHEPGNALVAEKCITHSAPYFPDHFPSQPVLPMTILLQCKMNLAKQFLHKAGFSTAYQVQELRKIKMNEFVYPGDVLTTYLNVTQRTEQALTLRFRSEVNGKRVCIVEMFMTAKVSNI